jgi:uncharacterized protein (TIGR02246 family)
MRNVISALTVALLAAAAPALAQQNTASNARTMARAVAIEKAIVELFNKKDAAGLAAHYTSDGIYVGPDGKPVTGRAAIEAAYAASFKAWGDFNFAGEVKAARAVGGAFWTLVEATVDRKGSAAPMTLRSHVVSVLVPAGRDWKIQLASIGPNVSPPSAPPQP